MGSGVLSESVADESSPPSVAEGSDALSEPLSSPPSEPVSVGASPPSVAVASEPPAAEDSPPASPPSPPSEPPAPSEGLEGSLSPESVWISLGMPVGICWACSGCVSGWFVTCVGPWMVKQDSVERGQNVPRRGRAWRGGERWCTSFWRCCV